MIDETRYNFPDLQTTFPAPFVAHVEINRPKKYNSFSPDVFHSLALVFDRLSEDENVRCVLLSGVGEHLSSGLDGLTVSKVQAADSSGPVGKPKESDDVARRTWKIRRLCVDYQNGINAVERCEKPVIILCHGIVYGAAIDLALAADIRRCSKDVRFSIKEVDVGLAADVGTLSRLPKVGVSYSWAKEVVYTARVFGAEEASRVGFVSQVADSKVHLVREGMKLAELLATKSPVAVQSSKALFDFSRDRSVQDGLLYTAAWNGAMVQADDVKQAMLSGLQKRTPKFAKL
ncbi:enoyl- hydratase isomerase family [Lecanosticta acicola]|uniref:Enoyl- hydratase isomerase family n=1 Tax=Lecanosticta acicola TaxID=111012 RepID=A0AAI9EG33_9PEZI|nr:enoyl- hydratase isomerase family [Lecanosticta acicola]